MTQTGKGQIGSMYLPIVPIVNGRPPLYVVPDLPDDETDGES